MASILSQYSEPCGVLCISALPWTFVRSATSHRAAQIVCRILSERFPGRQFTTGNERPTHYPEAPDAYRIAALDPDTDRAVAAELATERDTNPQGLPKWIAFHYGPSPSDVTGYCAYLEHDLPVVRRCRADPELCYEASFFSDDPGEVDVLSANPNLFDQTD